MKTTLNICCVLFLFSLLASCSEDEVKIPSVSGLTCASTTFSTAAKAKEAYTATASVPYTGGNGLAYPAGSAIASTGVTGLTATLEAGTFSAGNGNLTFAISGTPAGIGTAVFVISAGGQTCDLQLQVEPSLLGIWTFTTEIKSACTDPANNESSNCSSRCIYTLTANTISDESRAGTYTTNGNKIVITSDGTTTEYTYNLSANTLVFVSPASPSSGCITTLTFTR